MLGPEPQAALEAMARALRERASDDAKKLFLEQTREDSELFDDLQAFVSGSGDAETALLRVVQFVLLFRQ